MDRTGKDAAGHAQSVRITTAHTSHSERIRGRQRRYLISMGIRTVCFILAVVADGWLRWGFIIAAVVLPYFAVIAANAAGEVDDGGPEPFVDDSRPMLEPGPSAANSAANSAAGSTDGQTGSREHTEQTGWTEQAGWTEQTGT
jgi:Protein of unknown function (DUF3099)